MIYGPSGVGKTTLARHLLDELRIAAGVDYAHISAGKSSSAIFHEAIVKHPREIAVHPNIAGHRLIDRLETIVEHPFVIILEEADSLPKTSILEDLYRVPNLSVIVILHDPEQWLGRLDEPIQARYPLTHRIELDRYGDEQLADILEERARWGLEPGVISRERLKILADEVAGVARLGIQSLRAAAEIATERGHDRIHAEDIDPAYTRARSDIRAANIRSLPFGHQVVYELIRTAPDATMQAGELCDRYGVIAPQVYPDRDRRVVARRPVGAPDVADCRVR